MPEVLGLKVDVLAKSEIEQTLVRILQVESNTSHFIVTANAEMYYQASKDAALARAINRADFCLPDSQGIVWALQKQGIKAEVYPGVELAQWLIGQGFSIYALGSTEEVLQDLQQANIIGKHHGYFQTEEEENIIAEINRLAPQVLLVGLGAGKQELWIAKHRDCLKACLIIGVGGALDVISGHKRRAPLFWRKLRLEWFYRLCREPRRWRRQLVLLNFWLANRKNQQIK